MDYIVTYSKRKSIAIYVHKDASVEVKAPKGMSKKAIVDFVYEKIDWINKTKEKILSNPIREFSKEEILEFIKKGQEILPLKVEYYSKLMKVTPMSIKIGNAKSYWGCCSANNRLTFSWRLMSLTDDLINYVVVHELAHIKEHNHSHNFWNEVEKILPDYKKYVKLLKNFNN